MELSSQILTQDYSKFDPKPFIGKVFTSYEVTLTQNDLILYALSIGCNMKDPLNRDHFKFTYENDENFQSFPTLAAALGIKQFGDFAQMPGFPKIDLTMLLHGEEEVQILKPLKGEGSKYVCKQKFIDFQDKGKMTIIVVEKTLEDVATGELHVRIIDHTVVRGMGGFGVKGTVPTVMKGIEKPKSSPDFVTEEKTLLNQAILYRLNGDSNSLHIDPAVSRRVNFERPILHGLCTYGFSTRAVFDKYGNGDSASIKKIGGRFTSHVFPGETLIIEMWKDSGKNQVYFETKTKERGLVVIKGYMEIEPQPKL